MRLPHLLVASPLFARRTNGAQGVGVRFLDRYSDLWSVVCMRQRDCGRLNERHGPAQNARREGGWCTGVERHDGGGGEKLAPAATVAPASLACLRLTATGARFRRQRTGGQPGNITSSSNVEYLLVSRLRQGLRWRRRLSQARQNGRRDTIKQAFGHPSRLQAARPPQAAISACPGQASG